MGVKLSIILTLCGAVLLSCLSPPKSSEVIVAKKEPKKEPKIETNAEKELSRIERRKKILESERLYSLRLEDVLDQALLRIDSYSFNTSFKEAYEVLANSVFTVNVEMDYDFHFSKKKRHLIINRLSPAATQIDVFTHTSDGLERILFHTKSPFEFTGDTLTDVNGDGLKDLVVNWYGTSGCCLKAFSDVYLIRNNLQSFSDPITFINPTFSSRERVIRGLCYGHPGETELYKFKWNGEKVDTLEYVAFETDDTNVRTGNVILSNQYPGHKDYKILRTVKSVPNDYRNIEGYSWFAAERIYD